MAIWETEQVPLVIRLFGPFEITIHGKELSHLRTRKGQWLLALLILHRGGPVERSWLAGTLWPESTESQALANLRQSLANLRRALGNEAVRLTGPTNLELAFDLTGVFVDVCLFDTYADSMEAELLEQAIALYRAPLLNGCDEVWVYQERQAREHTILEILERMATLSQERNDPDKAISYFHHAAQIDPLRESVQRKLMEALAAREGFAAAQQVYRDLCIRLHRELNAEPDSQTTDLFYRLRQSTQLKRNRLPAPALTAPIASPCRLPRPLTALIGRERELQEVLLRLTSSRLVTLVGTGGVGKTRLAIDVAEATVPQMMDGVYFVDLAPLTEGSLVTQTIVNALELKEAPSQSPLNLLQTHLQSKHILLLLDNCEHLLQECSQLAAVLLAACPHLRILATSRQALGITGEVSYRVPMLAVPPVGQASDRVKDRLSQLADYASVRLFVERAYAALSDFELTGHNLMVIAQICRRLDGIPLALEIAAARVKALSLSQIAERLQASFSLLNTGNRASLARQHTLRATLDWSWGLLTASEKVLLGRLSVFAGGWTLEAVMGVTGQDEEILEVLSSLVDKSLVLFQEQNGLERYRMLETVRRYALDRLEESGESHAIRERHRNYFLALAQNTRLKLRGADQAVWLDRLQAEHENLRVGLEWSLSESGEGEALQMSWVLLRFWLSGGHLTEGREWCMRALGRSCTPLYIRDRAKTLEIAGIIANHLGDYASAKTYIEECLPIFQEIGDRSSYAAALNDLGAVFQNQSDFVCAIANFEECLSIQTEVGNRDGIASVLLNLGIHAHLQGDNARARANYETSLAIYREIEDWTGIAHALDGLGNVSSSQGDNECARTYYEESLVIDRKIGNRRSLAISLNNLGNVVKDQGDFNGARENFEQSLTIFREVGDVAGIAISLNNLGLLAADQGDYVCARTYYAESLAIQRQTGSRMMIALLLNNLGSAVQNLGDHASARSLYEESLAIYREIGTLKGMSLTLNNLGSMFQDLNDYITARRYYVEGLAIRREIGDKIGIALSLESLADLAVTMSRMVQATVLWGAAEALRQILASPMEPMNRKRYDFVVAQARQSLDAERFSAAWAQGRDMPLDDMVALINEGDASVINADET